MIFTGRSSARKSTKLPLCGEDLKWRRRQEIGFEKTYEITFPKNPETLSAYVGQHDTHEWLIASFDGLNMEKGISLEIKCPNEVPDVVREWKSWDRYYWQVQAQLAVGGHENAILLVYSPGMQRIETIARDELAIQSLIEKGYEFSQRIANLDPPPMPVIHREDEEAKEFAESAKKTQISKSTILDEEWKILREGGIYLAKDIFL